MKQGLKLSRDSAPCLSEMGTQSTPQALKLHRMHLKMKWRNHLTVLRGYNVRQVTQPVGAGEASAVVKYIICNHRKSLLKV